MYFDSNYILKCYLPEPGAELVRALAEQPVPKACSRLGRLEVLGALHRKLREGSLSRAQLKAIWNHLLEDENAGVWTWLPIDAAVEHAVERAFLQLGAKTFLRTGAAVHLATAALHGFAAIHSHDAHVLKAAAAFGLAAVDVVPEPSAGSTEIRRIDILAFATILLGHGTGQQ